MIGQEVVSFRQTYLASLWYNKTWFCLDKHPWHIEEEEHSNSNRKFLSVSYYARELLFVLVSVMTAYEINIVTAKLYVYCSY